MKKLLSLLLLLTLAACGRNAEEVMDPNAFVVDEATQGSLNALMSRAVVTEAYKCPTADLKACAEQVKQNIAQYVQAHPETQTIKVPTPSRKYITDSAPWYGPYGGYGQVNRFYNPYTYGSGVYGKGCNAYGCVAAGAQQDYYGAGAGFLYSGTQGYAGVGIKCSVLIGGCIGVAGTNGIGAAGYCGAYGCTGVTW